MELLYYLTVGIGVIALTLIINLFLSLKQTDKLVEEAEVIEPPKPKAPKKPLEKKGKSLKALKHDLKKQELKDFKHGLLVTNLKGHINGANDGRFAQNGKLFVSCDAEQSLMLWNVKDFGKGNTVNRYNTEYEQMKTLAISPDSKAIIVSMATSNKTKVFKVVKKEGGGYTAEQLGSENPDYNTKTEILGAEVGVQFQSGIQNGAFLFHCYADHTVVLTDLRGSVLHQTKCASERDRGEIHLSACGKFFGFCGDSSELRVWTIVFKSGTFLEVKRLPSLIGHKARLTAFAFSPDSTRILSLAADNEFKLWNMDVDWQHGQPPQELFSFPNSFGAIQSLSIAPDNLTVALANENTATIFALSDPKINFSIEKMFNGKIQQLQFDPTSNLLAITGDKFVRIFENYVGWKARVLEYGKAMQLASNDTHLSRLKVQMAEAENTLAKLDANLLRSL